MSNRKLTRTDRRGGRRLSPKPERSIICAKVTAPGVRGEQANAAIAVLDISRKGLCLLVGEPFEAGQAVLIAYWDPHYDRTVEVAGKVHWATPDRVDSFRIGVELEEELSPHQVRLLTRLTTERPGE